MIIKRDNNGLELHRRGECLRYLVAMAMFDHKFVFQYFSNDLNKS